MTVGLINKRTAIIIELCVRIFALLALRFQEFVYRVYNNITMTDACAFIFLYKFLLEYFDITVTLSRSRTEFTGKDPMIPRRGWVFSLQQPHLIKVDTREESCTNYIKCIRVISKYIRIYVFYWMQVKSYFFLIYMHRENLILLYIYTHTQ